MIKIKMLLDDPSDSCSYHRGLGVMAKLRYLDENINVSFIEVRDWAGIADADILFVERPFLPDHLKFIEMAKDFGVKVWLDYDDNFFCIPEDNPGYAIITGCKENIFNCIKLADVISVSTQSLEDEYGQINANIKVIPNAFNDYNFKFDSKPSDKKIIAWRGSSTHRNDLLSVREEIIEAKNTFAKDWLWQFIGCDVWYTLEGYNMKNISKPLPLVAYWKYIKNLNPSIWTCPLVVSKFNEGKSNIAWIEATYAGAVCIAPNSLPEFRKTPAAGYDRNFTGGTFKDILHLYMDNFLHRKDRHERSIKYIKENLLLSDVNKLRINLIKETI